MKNSAHPKLAFASCVMRDSLESTRRRRYYVTRIPKACSSDPQWGLNTDKRQAVALDIETQRRFRAYCKYHGFSCRFQATVAAPAGHKNNAAISEAESLGFVRGYHNAVATVFREDAMDVALFRKLIKACGYAGADAKDLATYRKYGLIK